MKAILITLSILLAGSITFASDAGMSCSSQGILPGGCTDVPKTVAKNHVIFDIPKIHCGGCKKNIDKVVKKLKLPETVSHEVSVETKKVALIFDDSVSDEDAKAHTAKVRKALNKKGYKITN